MLLLASRCRDGPTSNARDPCSPLVLRELASFPWEWMVLTFTFKSDVSNRRLFCCEQSLSSSMLEEAPTCLRSPLTETHCVGRDAVGVLHVLPFSTYDPSKMTFVSQKKQSVPRACPGHGASAGSSHPSAFTWALSDTAATCFSGDGFPDT